MATRWVIYPDAADRVPTEPLLRELGERVVVDMKEGVPVDKGFLKAGIELTAVDDESAIITSVRPPGGGGTGPTQAQYREEVPFFVENGTSDTPAEPYMRPATYKYRTP